MVFKEGPASTMALSHQDWSALGLTQDVKREEEEEENTSSKSWIAALREVRERSREKKRLIIMSVILKRFSMKKVLFRRVVVKGAEGTSHFFHEQTYRF